MVQQYLVKYTAHGDIWQLGSYASLMPLIARKEPIHLRHRHRFMILSRWSFPNMRQHLTELRKCKHH